MTHVILRQALLVLLTLTLVGCSTLGSAVDRGEALLGFGAQGEEFLKSGTIIVSMRLPESGVEVASAAGIDSKPHKMAPILGYIPPTVGFVPAENETWLEIDHASNDVIVYRGKVVVKQFKGDGSVTLAPGVYALQHKQKKPLWYAPDQYFTKRRLAVPKPGDRLRYRRGALGSYVLYPTTTFPVHSAPLWSEDVGGLRLSRSDLSSIYYMLPIGASVVVK